MRLTCLGLGLLGCGTAKDTPAGTGQGGSSAGGAATQGGSSTGGAATAGTTTVTGPCDIYASGDTPCVAAHSTVRALYGSYSGNLYQVRRLSDETTKDIGVLAPGGFADSAAQDSFCAGTTCGISIIYDQSPQGNHLTAAPGGGAVEAPDREVNANRYQLTVGGHTVYAAYFDSGMGYRNNNTTGVSTGDQPQSMYMVTSAIHYNDQCCFDYGNAETTNNNDGNGTMEAIYFGNCTYWGQGTGSGPWVMADLENGLFGGQDFSLNASNISLNHDAPNAAPPQYPLAQSFTDGNWHITGTVVSGQWAGAGLWFGTSCPVMDFSAYQGISFTIGGDVGPSSSINVSVSTAANSKPNTDTTSSSFTCYSNAATCTAATCTPASLTVSNITPTSQTVRLLWAELSNGIPSATPNPAEITGIAITPTLDFSGTASPYSLDLVIDDLALIP